MSTDQQPEDDLPASAPTDAAAPATGTILCVEDDAAIQGLYRIILGRRGYEITMCDSGEAALEYLEQARPDLVILDLYLPRMSGLDVLEQMSQDPGTAGVPVIVISCSSGEQNISEALRLGAADYITKPVRGGELAAKVGVIINRDAIRRRARLPRRPGLFAERFELGPRLGSGASSTVYRAVDTSVTPGRTVALKIYDLRFDRVDDLEHAMACFLREAYQHSKLHHPNIVRLLDFGRTDAGQLYLALEYLEGDTLIDVLLTYGELPPDQVAFIGYELAKALDYLHARNLVHRDLTPSNIMITSGGDIKLIDLGLAQGVLDRLRGERGQVIGNPLYIAPECLRGLSAPDTLSDVFSFGVTLYLCLHRYTPFGGTPEEVLEQRCTTPFPPIASVVPGLSEPLAGVIDSMTHPDPDVRPVPHDLQVFFANLLQNESLTT